MPRKLLVIDDEKNIRESSVRLLQRKGYDARGAGSGAEALRIIQGESFDLLLLDVRMPGMDGIEVLRRATELVPEIQVLMLTGHGTLDMAAEAIEYGAIGFLRKPIDIDTLQKSIDDALARGDTRKENARLRALMPLFELNKQLLSELDEGKLIDLILRTVKSEFRADNAEITLWDEGGSRIKKFAVNNAPTGQNTPPETDDAMINRVSTSMEPLVFSRTANAVLESPDDNPLTSFAYDIYVPLIARNRAIGTVRATKLTPEKRLQSSDIEFLSTLCGQSSIGLTNARLYDSLGKAHVEVEELLRRVITNTEDERLRISLELHDGPIQSIFASQFAIQACRGLLNDNVGQVDDKLQSIAKTLLESTRNLRRIVSDLHPPDLEKSGLLSAIQEYLSIIESENRMKCHLKVKGNVAKLAYSTERGLYYMVREAVTNIKKHAEASTIDVTVECRGDDLTVTVHDDGKGFDPSTVEANPGIDHFGLRSIKERARVLRGEVAIESGPGEGTTVTLVLPLKSHIRE